MSKFEMSMDDLNVYTLVDLSHRSTAFRQRLPRQQGRKTPVSKAAAGARGLNAVYLGVYLFNDHIDMENDDQIGFHGI